jgi:hypothetical protein
MWNSFLVWWATIPTWAKSVLLAFLLGAGWKIASRVPWAIKQVKALWNWIDHRHDRKLFALMNDARRKARLEHPTLNLLPLPFKTAELATGLKITEARARKCLLRLETAGKVLEVKNGEWCMGNKTHKEILDDQWGQDRFSGNRLNRAWPT